jgi:hypothetical protein
MPMPMSLRIRTVPSGVAGPAVLLVDDHCPECPPALLEALLEAAVTSGPGAAVLVSAVPDTLKVLDADGALRRTADRQEHRRLLGPAALPAELLPVLTGLIQRPGTEGRQTEATLPTPAEWLPGGAEIIGIEAATLPTALARLAARGVPIRPVSAG